MSFLSMEGHRKSNPRTGKFRMSHSNQCGTPTETVVQQWLRVRPQFCGFYLALLHIRQLNWNANIVFDQEPNKYKCKTTRLTFGLISKLIKQFCARDCERINRLLLRSIRELFAETAVCQTLENYIHLASNGCALRKQANEPEKRMCKQQPLSISK